MTLGQFLFAEYMIWPLSLAVFVCSWMASVLTSRLHWITSSFIPMKKWCLNPLMAGALAWRLPMSLHVCLL
ncbi:hypothetical protein MT325_m547R [Paramecium bursaria chlorella virus MT325]|uniref:Uncharacterized protein m547R n=1 Tax=Paramecium bursaria Chlorella virus MT325 TaxID=346932 RepID=A7IUS7_PBCVM|nr:hypothetical protein MT325_m547R [Paramecium bursaria chlorella virus MT325]